MKPLPEKDREAIAARYRPEVPLFTSLRAMFRWGVYGAAYDGDTVGESPTSKYIPTNHREQIHDPQQKRRVPSAIRTARKPKRQAASGQAGMIQAYLIEAPLIDAAHIAANDLLGDEKKAGLRFMKDEVFERVRHECDKKRVINTLVAEYYGKPVDLTELREKHQLKPKQFDRARRAVQITLDAVSAKAEQAAYDHFQKGGVLA